MSLLETINIVKTFGGLIAVNKVSFKLDSGRIVSIIGPNGAGKTTFFNTLTGIYHPDQGHITFNGKSLHGLRPDQIASRGISRTFQNIRLFSNMSVIENILVGMHVHLKQSPIDTLFHLSFFKNEEKESEHKAEELMTYVGLKDVGNELAKNLPYGGQRRLEIARALAADPLMLLQKNATITVCHSRTRNIAAEVCTADIVLAAVGIPRFVTRDMVKPGAVVIDVGINRTEHGLVGDCDFEGLRDVASAMTPVPGGVGPMTIAQLLVNTLEAYVEHVG